MIMEFDTKTAGVNTPLAKLCPCRSSNSTACWSKHANKNYVWQNFMNMQGCAGFKSCPPVFEMPLKISCRFPCDSQCHSCLLSMENIALFCIVWHTAQLYKLRNQGGIHKGQLLTGRRHIVPRGDPQRSDQLADFTLSGLHILENRHWYSRTTVMLQKSFRLGKISLSFRCH